MRQVILIGNDITKYVSDIPLVTHVAGEYGQVVINEIAALTGVNTTGFWDAHNPASPFFSADPATFNLQIYIDGNKTYEGFIKKITSDNANRTATVELRSLMQTALEHGAIYVSNAPETPSDAIKNICVQYEIPIEAASFSLSSAFYTADLVYIEVSRQRPEGSVLDLIQQIAEIGCMRLYSYNQQVYCDAYQTPASVSVYTFTDSLLDVAGVSLLSHPESETIEKEPVLGYRIETVYGPVTLGDENQQGKTISAGPDAAVRILSLQAGVFIGNLWITYLNRKQKRISFTTKAGIGKVLALGMAVTVNYNKRGWANTIIDLTEINQTDKLTANLAGVTR